MAMKKAFFFSLDAFFAVMIFTLILVAIYGYFVGTQELRQQYFFSEDIFNIFINTKMEESNLYGGFYNYVEGNYPIFLDIIDPKLTIMEQIVTLKNNGTDEAILIAQHLIEVLTTGLFDKYGFSVDVKNDIIYPIEVEEGDTIVSRQRFVSEIKKIRI